MLGSQVTVQLGIRSFVFFCCPVVVRCHVGLRWYGYKDGVQQTGRRPKLKQARAKKRRNIGLQYSRDVMILRSPLTCVVLGTAFADSHVVSRAFLLRPLLCCHRDLGCDTCQCVASSFDFSRSIEELAFIFARAEAYYAARRRGY
jgi:hypothetical protein